MAKATHYQLLWKLAGDESVDAGQEWVLTAMQRHGPALVTMLWRILGSEQDVCDAYQDTFIKLAHGQSGRKPEKIVDEFYQRALGRRPSRKERDYWGKHLATAKNAQRRQEILEDFLWSLIACREFATNH